MTETLQEIPIESIHESPTNTRRSWGDLEGLAESIRKVGVLQAVLLRPTNGGHEHELVFGHRRFRAAKLAGLDRIPANVRQLTDLEVVEAQVIENNQRTDLHPLEEAEGFRLLQVHGLHAEDIAAKIGRSRSYVYGRLKLTELAEPVRKLFLDEKLSPSVAEVIARIPDEKLQAQAAKDCVGDEYRPPMSFHRAADLIRERYMLVLKDAPFDTGDEQLVPKAGSCLTCPKRTGAQPELFADVKSPDVCTDPPCFDEKRDAAWNQKADAARTAGQHVIEGKKANQVFDQYGYLRRDAGLTDLDAQNYDDPKSRTYRQLLKKAKPATILARDPKGKERELVDNKELGKALKEAGFKSPAREAPSRSSSSSSASSKKAKEERELREQINQRAIGEAVRAVESKQPKGDFWTSLAVRFAARADGSSEIAVRRGLKKDDRVSDHDASKAIEKQIPSMTMDQIRGLLFELSIPPYSGDAELKKILAEVGVDVAAVAKTVKAERKADASGEQMRQAKTWPSVPDADTKKPPKKPAAKKSPARKK